MNEQLKTNFLQLTALSLLFQALPILAEDTGGIQILSATVKDQKIAGASVTLQKNGEQSVTAATNAQGQVNLNSAFVNDPSALLIVKKPGYSDLVVKCPCAGMTYAVSPVMKNLDGMRIVLNWGQKPEDLDSHIVYPNNHVYFSNMTGTDALLDVDDTTSYGPETITIDRKHDGERYVYAVHNFTDGSEPDSTRLSASHAKVFVYVGQTLVKTYYVPKNQTGNLWTVFAVTESGDFQDFNTIKGVTSHDRLQTSEFQGIIDNSTVQLTDYSADSQQNAKDLNAEGERAYHAGNYAEAIRLYQSAIELDGNYGQAYSNLGLAFQKAGNVAEALWANRKAIALANGATAATVRASSHYNNGKIYEAAGQWNDALREYHYAKREKDNTVYDKAIKRMQQKGAK
ncbi:MAG: tetratricopeptide repeat protein [Methylovulum sp.]|uniref:YfaP family protein n=1 Tax=Methylovulum sp. TaxID=1916980 RepID=UPI0026235295|nr:tetratricopeptide repeat protein [Methylovulum sp.]MDD2723236.1 tetratricopeptide repeat protein [Methylovulum sp.]MDD5123443.1 tetratricopeptide repeat protein [Methylovulum sp.]